MTALLICAGAKIIMLARGGAKGTKWEYAVVSCMDHGNLVWARVKARQNREFAVVRTDEIEQGYGTCYYKIKKEPMPCACERRMQTGTLASPACPEP